MIMLDSKGAGTSATNGTTTAAATSEATTAPAASNPDDLPF